METTIGARLREFREFKGMRQNAFCELAGIRQQTLSTIEADSAAPSTPVLQKLFTAYPDLNPTWLLLGDGPMLKGGRELTPADQLPPPVPSEAKPARVAPGLIPATGGLSAAYGGSMSIIGDDSYQERHIRSLEAENAKKDALIAWLQEQNAILLGKSPASAYAAGPYMSTEAPALIGPRFDTPTMWLNRDAA